ncbi:hypothetical protein ACUJ8H_17285 [Streptomyces sp. EKR5.2]
MANHEPAFMQERYAAAVAAHRTGGGVPGLGMVVELSDRQEHALG